MVVDQLALGIADRALNRVELLRQINTRPSRLEHRQHAGQMAVRAFEPGNDVGVRRVFQPYPILQGRIAEIAIARYPLAKMNSVFQRGECLKTTHSRRSRAI